MMITYGFTKELSLPVDKAIEVTTEQLKQEGFGVLTRIDLDQKFKEKLGIDFKRYVILGACNPPFAHKSLLAEENIGLFLPCNVILYEKGEKTVLAIIKPTVAMNMIANEPLRALASEVEEKLQRVFERVG
jgi:uncharacterized protein (DUF302 family)